MASPWPVHGQFSGQFFVQPNFHVTPRHRK